MEANPPSEEPLPKRLKSMHHGTLSTHGVEVAECLTEQAHPTNGPTAHEDSESNEGEEDDGEIYEGSCASSMIEDILDIAEDNPYHLQDEEDEQEAFSTDECQQIKAHLRRVGAHEFIETYLTSGKYALRRLATAFGVPPNLPFPDSTYMKILGSCIQKEIHKRQRLAQYNTLDDAVKLIEESKNILVITGAGISTSLGIPDFRSKNTGFYSKLREQGYHEPEQVFDLHEFDADPSIFYTLAKEILPITDRCSTTHAFIKLLQDKGKLLTNYTQNIDNVEAIAGIEPGKLIQCHGSWATASCRKCGTTVPGTEIFADVEAQTVSRCKACVKVDPSSKRKPVKRPAKKSDFSDDESNGEFDVFQPGVMKPGITFFYEQLPNTFFDRLTDHDKDLVDLVIVIGTSMKVSPVNQIPNYISGEVPHIYISKDPVSHVNFDIQLLGYCDDVVSELSRRAGWTIDHAGFDPTVDAKVERYDEDSGHHWIVQIPGKEHTVEEKAEAEK